MKLEDIKNMSDEEFIELVKNMIKEEEKTEKNIICVNPKKFNHIDIITLLEYLICILGGEACGIGLGGIVGTFKPNTDIIVTTGLVTGTIFSVIFSLINYYYDKRQKNKDAERFKRRKIEIETELKNNILNLKKSLEKLSDEEFNLLVDGINLINENKFDNELIKKSNVLVIANKLIELNATDLLKEFDDKQNENNVSYKYNDGEIDLGYSKIKGN